MADTAQIEEIVRQVLASMSGEASAAPGGSAGGAIPKTAHVAMLTGLEHFDVKEFPMPEVGDDDMLVRVEGCGICGTDAHEFKRDPFGLIPVALGHEGTGEIVKMGKNVKKDSAGKDLKLGDKVVTCMIFKPVSSSGHLQIAKELLGVEIEENLTFDVTLHAATVLSTLVVLWSEVRRLVQGLFSRRFNAEQAYVLKIVLSMIPIGIVGFALKDRIDAMLGAPWILAVVGAMLLLTAALLAFAYYAKPRQKEDISYRDAFIIGIAQACAAMPGLSRSGSTIATGLLLGNKKAAVAQFSFLMVLAPILGETLLEIASGKLTAGVAAGPLLAGFAAAFVTGCLACRFMIETVKQGRLIWFALYCAVAGGICIISYCI